MVRFYGKKVYITGGSSGIGLATAKLLAAGGADVLLLARRPQILAEAVQEVKTCTVSSRQVVSSFSLDVSRREDVEAVLSRAVREFGVPDVLINSAGRARPEYADRITYAQFDETLKVDLYGTWNTISVLLPSMKEKGGHIVNVSSIVGFIGVFGYADYAAAKFGIIGLSEVLRSELKRWGIAVSVLCPPDTETPGFALENETKPEETRAISAAARLMQPEDVAGALLKGMGKGAFLIIPNREGRFTWLMKRFVPGLVERVMDADIRKVQRKKTGMVGTER